MRQSRQSRDLFLLVFTKAKQTKQRIINSWFQQGKVETHFYLFLQRQSKKKQRINFPSISYYFHIPKIFLIFFVFSKAKQAKLETYSYLFFTMAKQTKQIINFLVFSKAKQAKQRLILTCFQESKVDKVENKSSKFSKAKQAKQKLLLTCFQQSKIDKVEN